MQDKVTTMRKALRPWALGAMCALAFAAPVAQASLVGQTVTVGVNYFGSYYATSGVAGTDSLQVIFGGQNTRFDPTFSGNSISLGFATDFDSGGWYFPDVPGGTNVTFSGLDSPGLSIASVAFIATVADSNLTPSDLTWTGSSLTLNLGNKNLQNSDTIRFDITYAPAAVNAVPEPGTLALLGAAGVGLVASRRRRG